jgi:uncharacterized linocin/CFP29 family protein
MGDYLMRDAAPLSAEEWSRIDEVVIQTARQYLVGRRFIELVGPMGAGLEVVPMGSGENRTRIELTVFQEDFTLYWRDVEANRKAGLPPELGPAAMAAAKCARQEDQLVLVEGLIGAAGNRVALDDWSEPSAALETVTLAIKELVADDFYGPYAVVLSPARYAKTQGIERGMGRLVSKLIKDMAEGGLYQSPLLGDEQGLVVSLGRPNFDLVIGQDLTTAYIGNDAMDHLYRVIESIALRVKRPESICVLSQ